MITHAMMDTDAWRDLSGNAVKLLLHLVKMHNGSNNGDLFLAERDAAAALGIVKNTASRAFQDLVSHGFLRVSQLGSFDVKVGRATSWRLTFLHARGNGPTHEYRKWRPDEKSRAQNLGLAGSEIDPKSRARRSAGSKIDPANCKNGSFT
jgi:hypothetical protein